MGGVTFAPQVRREAEDKRRRTATGPGGVRPATPAAQSTMAQRRASGPPAVPLFLRSRLELGREDDPLEREADRIAERVGASPSKSGAIAADPPRRRHLPLFLGRELATGGARLDPETRGRMEALLGHDLAGVRIHTDADSASQAARLNARAFTVGADVAFGDGEFAPRSPQGERLLAHELTHVVQQGAAPPLAGGAAPVAGTAARPVVQRQERERGIPVTFDFGTTIPPEIEERYPLLLQALNAEERQQLEIAFTGLAVGVTPAPQTPVPGVARRSGTIFVPLSRLITDQARFVDRDPWESVFALLRAHASPLLVGAMIQNEIMRRFFERNDLAMESSAGIRVVETQAPLSSMRLDFELDGRPLTNSQGALTPRDLDSMRGVRLDEVIAEVSGEAHNVGLAAALMGDLVHQDRRITGIHDGSRSGFRDYSLRSLRMRLGALRENKRAAQNLRRGGPVPVAAQDLASQYDPLITRMETLVSEGEAWHREHQPMVTRGEAAEGVGVAAVGAAERNWDRGDYLSGGALYAGGFLVAMFDGLGNLVTFGYQNAERDSTQAYRRGDISYADMEDFQDAALTRSLIVGIVTVALTIATAGVGASVAGGLGLASGSLSAAMVGGGVEASIITFGSMTTETIVTDVQTMSSPTTQAIWEQGHHTPGQIAFGTVLAGGFGTGGGALGYFARSGGSALATRQAVTGTREFVVGEYTILVDATGRAPVAVGTHATDAGLVFFARRDGAGFYRIGPGGTYTPIREVGRGGVNVTREAQQILALEEGAGGVWAQPGTSIVPVTPGLAQRQGAYVVSQEGSIVAVLPIAEEAGALGAPGLLAPIARQGLPRLSGLSAGPVVGSGRPPIMLGSPGSSGLTLPPGLVDAQGVAADPLVFIPLPPPPDPQVLARRMVGEFLEGAPATGAPTEAAVEELMSGYRRALPPPPPPQLDFSLSFMEPNAPFSSPVISPFGQLDPLGPLAPMQRPLLPLGPPRELPSIFVQPQPPPEPWLQRPSGLLVPQSAAERIRTLGPGGQIQGWGGFDISTSMMWAPERRFTQWDRQAMEDIAGRLSRIRNLDPAGWSAVGTPGALNPAQRERAIRRAVVQTLDALGIPRSRRPDIRVQAMSPNRYGWASWQFNQLPNGQLVPQTQRGEIVINSALSVGDAVGTAVHESRHYFQMYQAYRASLGHAAHPNAARWRPNLPGMPGGTYYTLPDPRYFTQPIETDAESFGRRTTDELPSERRWPR